MALDWLLPVRCLLWGLQIHFWIAWDCAGVLTLWLWIGPSIWSWIAWLPVFQWVLLCGSSYFDSSLWGVCEVMCQHVDGLRTHHPMGNFVPEVGLRPLEYLNQYIMQGFSPLAAPCFHHLVKKSALQLTGDQTGIQNAFKQGRHQFCAATVWPPPGQFTLVQCRLNSGRLSFSGQFWSSTIFDATLGFPRWSIISANIDSFATNVNCLQWDADAFMLQEARIAESNMAEAQRKAALCNFGLFCSQPLQKLKASNGTFRIPSGGTATCAHKELTQLFDAKF